MSNVITTNVNGRAIEPERVKAWLSFEGQNTTAFESYGISSLVDNGSGDTTINLSSPMATATYPLSGMTGEVGSSDGGFVMLKDENSYAGQTGVGTAVTASSFRAQTMRCSDGFRADSSKVFLSVMGD